MEYKYLEKADYDKKIKDNTGDEWSCYSKKAARRNSLLKNWNIIGEIDINRQSRHGTEVKVCDKNLYFNNVHKRNPLFMSVVGYMLIEGQETAVVRIVKKNNRMPLFLLALLLIATATGLFWWMNKQGDGPILEDEAIAYKMPDGAKANDDPTKIMIPGYGELPIQAGTDELYAALLNPEGNQCYFKYRIILKEGNEIVYESNLIKPGMAVTNVKLNRRIDAGVYDIKLVVLAYSLDDYENQLNGGVVETKLVAK